jgi:predicted 3-demethylubiquinone-9 3-methyltransferase (glyoxalase superfamily)
MPKIIPFLWFDDQAEAAATFYCKVFKNSKILERRRNGRKVVGVTFRLEGQTLVALNGGPHYKMTPALSLFVDCKSQQEVDGLWRKLLRGGTPLRCGWITDRFGLTWQIIPSILGQLIGDKDPVKAERAWDAMIQMRKIDVKALKRAHAGK